MDRNRVRFEAIPARRRSDEVVARIERQILSRELGIGEALPPERELAAQFQVSRNILREAIGVLTQKGLLEVRHGAGTFVARPSVDFVRESLSVFVRFNHAAFWDLVEARLALETRIAALAAERATDDDLDEIARCLAEMEAAGDDHEAFVDADVRFHAALAAAARNQILNTLLFSIRDVLRDNIALLVSHQKPAIAESNAYHRRIVSAVRERRPDEAQRAMEEHLESVRAGLQEVLSRLEADESIG
jgi:GntR family transcriptional repressor for pyruvate dehydrogenase complex